MPCRRTFISIYWTPCLEKKLDCWRSNSTRSETLIGSKEQSLREKGLAPKAAKFNSLSPSSTPQPLSYLPSPSTGLSYKVVPRLRECRTQGQAEVVSKSRCQIHQTWDPPLSRALNLRSSFPTTFSLASTHHKSGPLSPPRPSARRRPRGRRS